MLFLIMSKAQGDDLRGEVSPGIAIDPIEVLAGTYVGQYVVPARLLDLPDFAPIHDILAEFSIVDIDPGEAWPPEEG